MTLKQKTQARREQIAQAALQGLAEHGPAELNLAPIAARLGLATSALYRHFSGKDEILNTVIDLVEIRLAANAAEASRKSEDPLECLEFLLQRHVALVQENSGVPRLLFSGEVFGGGGARRERLFRLIDGYLTLVAEIILKGQQAGGIRADIDPRTLAVHFLGIVQPAVILEHLSGGRFDVTLHAKKAWMLFTEAVVPREKECRRINQPRR